MSTSRHLLYATATLALSVLALAAAAVRAAGDTDAPVVGQPYPLLAPTEELDVINLSIVDEKLALSLAVEIHVQIELTEFALAGIQHDSLKQLNLKKLALYHRLLDTLNNLTSGRATAVLVNSPRQHEGVRQRTTADATSPSHPQSGATATAAVGQDPQAAGELQPASARTAGGRETRKVTRKGGGIGSVLQNAATAAILRVRLEIAEQYGGLLRAELAAIPPAEFDRHYLAIEVFSQMQVMAMLRVFEQQASPDFARILHVATATAEAHLVEARQVTEILKSIPQPAPLPALPLVHAVETSGS